MEERTNSKLAPLLNTKTSLDKKSFNKLLDELLSAIEGQDDTKNDMVDDNDPFWRKLIGKVTEIIPLQPTNQPITKQYACKVIASLLTILHPDQKTFSYDELDDKKDVKEALQIIFRLSLLMLIGHPISSDMFPTQVEPNLIKRKDTNKLFRGIIRTKQTQQNIVATNLYSLIEVIGFNLLHLAALRGETEVIATLANQSRYPQMLDSVSPQGTPVAIAIRKGVKDKAFNAIALQLLKTTDKTVSNKQLTKLRNNALLACDRTRQNQKKLHPFSAIDVAAIENSDLTSTLLKHCACDKKTFKFAIVKGHLRQVKWIHQAVLATFRENFADDSALKLATEKNQEEIVKFLNSQINDTNNNNDENDSSQEREDDSSSELTL